MRRFLAALIAGLALLAWTGETRADPPYYWFHHPYRTANQVQPNQVQPMYDFGQPVLNLNGEYNVPVQPGPGGNMQHYYATTPFPGLLPYSQYHVFTANPQPPRGFYWNPGGGYGFTTFNNFVPPR